MTDREKAIIMAYTGISMLTGDKFSIFHEYIEDILGRSVWTHELADHDVWEEIKEKSKSDFLKLCESDGPMGAEWIQETVETEYGKFPKLLCSACRNPRAQIPMNYCGNCGEKMKNPDATIKGETTYEK